jgi:alpha-L-rhamnosidase
VDHRRQRSRATLLLLAACVGLLVPRTAAALDDRVRAVGLRTDGAETLLGTDAIRPRLEWRLESARRGVLQVAQQVLVASSPALLRPGRADVWDSRRIAPRTLAGAALVAPLGGAAVRAPAIAGPAVRASEPWADYGGPALAPHTRYYWTVRVWDETGRASAFAEPTWFETGFLDPRRWRADWIAGGPRVRRDGVDAFVAPVELEARGEPCRPIGPPGPLALAAEPRRDEYIARWAASCRAPRPAPLLRREFEVAGTVARARLYVSGLAYAEVHLNGARVGGDVVLDPGYTDYGRTVLYATHDVTALLQAGRNAVGVELGSGFFDYDVVSEWAWDRASWRADPRLRLELHVTLHDGRTQVVPSDASWRATDGPTRYDNANIGETHDARAEPDGWTEPGFDDVGWAAARVVAAPGGALVAQTHEPIAVVARRTPIASSEPRPGIRVYDVGEQVTGWAEIELAGDPGTVAEIRYAEGLLPDGTVDLTRNLHIADRLQTDYLVVGATGRTRWRPRFSYKGFRYVQVSGPRESALAASVAAIGIEVVRSAVRATATFTSDHELLNGIHDMVARTIANNLHGIVTDTPVYEKNGWTGDAQLTAPTAAALFDMRRFYAKWLRDMRDAQRPDGELPVIVPTGGGYGFTGVGWESAWGATPAWDAALFLIPWEVYAAYGDLRPLAASYEAMQAYVDDFMPAWSPGDLVESDLGDWLTPSAQLTRLVPSAYHAEFVRRMALHADLLGRPGDRERYERLHRRIAAAFDAAFYDPVAGVYRQDAADGFAQTAQVLALAFGLVPEARRARVVEAVVRDVAERGGNLATGIVGTRYLLKELTRAGRIDVAFGIATQTDRPSWGEWHALGYSTLLEAWGPAVRSQDHHMFGSIGQWLLEDLAGIEPRRPGYVETEIRPEVPSAGLRQVAVTLHTARGLVASEWRLADGGFALDVTVPAGTTALVHVPAADPSEVAEVGGDGPARPAQGAVGVTLVGPAPGCVVYRVGSGTYRFRVGTAVPG